MGGGAAAGLHDVGVLGEVQLCCNGHAVLLGMGQGFCMIVVHSMGGLHGHCNYTHYFLTQLVYS